MVLARLSYTEFFEWLLPLILAVSILLFLDMFSFPRRPVMRILFTWVLKIFSFVGFAANAFVGVELIESTDGVTRSAGIGMFTFCILLILPLMLCALENDELKKDVRVILFYPALVGKPLMIIIEFLFYPFWQASTYNMIIAILAVFTTAVSLIFGFFEVLGLISLDEWGQKAREHLASGGGCMGDCVKDLRARSRRMSRRFSTHLSIRMASLSRNASESVAHNRSPGTAEKTVTPKPPDDMSCMVLFDPDPDPTQEEEVKVEGQHRRKSISFHIDTLDVEVAALFPLPAIQEEEEEAKGDGKIEEEEADDEAEIPSEGLQRSSHSFDDLEPGLPLDVTTAKRLCATMPKLPLIAPRGLGFSCIPPTSSHQTQTEKEVLGSGRKEREHKKNEAVAYSPASDPVLQHDTEKGKGTPVPTQKKEKQQEDNLDAVPREPMAEILPAVGRTAR
uniref:Uncharacterized protein n=1 Tax=Chromera velia CCMP2878 TaxID=1169474 RepID=A0A0G4HSE7_9ALVE|eukprot:Cvel_1309.t1-p1 / transcript=Cvel_1309.t1 / gene=Cvel_1309 / organism=Chromera_velia_CCMP2878 / gene_product=hypothetical protein / transcript_product=hypothetical protein / location=Cvel_scaffold44:110972-112315(+) / protein_length=448 / sequence_SO=supercontig / SO=protein_coding / is_pseudo=false